MQARGFDKIESLTLHKYLLKNYRNADRDTIQHGRDKQIFLKNEGE